ncbi:MAG: GspH/FimT family pseudopilin [Variovorax sp.]
MQCSLWSHVRGMTLVELMVTVSVMAIVVAIAVPSFATSINSTRLSSSATELSAALQLARAEAIKRNRDVVLCRSNDLVSCATGGQWNGWLIFVDANGNGTLDASEEIVKAGAIDSPLVLRASVAISSQADQVRFPPSGMARGASGAALLNAALAFCAPSAPAASNNVRDVHINFGGRTSVRSRDTAGDCSAAPVDA